MKKDAPWFEGEIGQRFRCSKLDFWLLSDAKSGRRVPFWCFGWLMMSISLQWLLRQWQFHNLSLDLALLMLFLNSVRHSQVTRRLDCHGLSLGVVQNVVETWSKSLRAVPDQSIHPRAREMLDRGEIEVHSTVFEDGTCRASCGGWSADGSDPVAIAQTGLWFAQAAAAKRAAIVRLVSHLLELGFAIGPPSVYSLKVVWPEPVEKSKYIDVFDLDDWLKIVDGLPAVLKAAMERRLALSRDEESAAAARATMAQLQATMNAVISGQEPPPVATGRAVSPAGPPLSGAALSPAGSQTVRSRAGRKPRRSDQARLVRPAEVRQSANA